MAVFPVRLVPGVALLILPLLGCAPDADRPLAVTGARTLGGVDLPVLTGAAPAVAPAEGAVTLTVRGSGLDAEIERVLVGEVEATRFAAVDATTLTVELASVGPELLGPQTVRIRFRGGVEVALPGAVRFLHRQDPVVFVHGCPLPPGFGSVTNYITSKYWYPLYNDLRSAGYPAPAWAEREEFVSNVHLTGTGHPATVPAPDNYLNVFPMSEDDRRAVHQENFDADVGGHCGSGYRMAEELARFVDRVLEATGADRVDLVVNSGGALGARLFLLRHLAGVREGKAPAVRDVVFLAAMNHGTEVGLIPTAGHSLDTFRSPNYDAAREGFPAYGCALSPLQREVNFCPGMDADPRKEIPRDHREHGSKGIAYLNIYNVVVDELIEPTTAACLFQRFAGDCTDTEINVPVHAVDDDAPRETPHSAIRADPQVRALTACFLRRRSHRKPVPDQGCEAERAAARVP